MFEQSSRLRDPERAGIVVATVASGPHVLRNAMFLWLLSIWAIVYIRDYIGDYYRAC